VDGIRRRSRGGADMWACHRGEVTLCRSRRCIGIVPLGGRTPSWWRCWGARRSQSSYKTRRSGSCVRGHVGRFGGLRHEVIWGRSCWESLLPHSTGGKQRPHDYRLALRIRRGTLFAIACWSNAVSVLETGAGTGIVEQDVVALDLLWRSIVAAFSIQNSTI
jgi:hypothetical protein